MKAVILWIEGRQSEGTPFINALRKKGYQVEIVSTGAEALTRLPVLTPDLIVINAASLRSSGKRICNTLRKQSNKLPIIVIAEAGQVSSNDDSATAVLVLPFTNRKLLNWITPLLPWEDDQVVKEGPIRLDLERRRVDCNGKVTRLTPSLTALLKLLMDRRGEVMNREDLFRTVWNTDYTGDTRTLDVHISWLRQALEENPRQPVYLKTIRGVGYRLDI
jgi:DNA-binding response OmpR family regulator